MLEKIQMPPALPLGIIGLAVRLTADRTIKTAAFGKIDQGGQLALYGIKFNLVDLSRDFKPQRQ
jgi:hypothetical protein